MRYSILLLALFVSACGPHLYTRAEAERLVGHSVTSAHSTTHHISIKCPEPEGECLPVPNGEKGIVIGVDPGDKDQYGIKIRWQDSEDDRPLYSYAYTETPELEID